MNNVILASASPRRKELLKKIITDFAIIPSDIAENYPSSLNKTDIALYLSNLKAYDVYSKNVNSLVIGVDTIVVIDNVILGKPVNREHAKDMLRMLSGKMHYVITGVSVYYNNQKYQINSINKVYFKTLTENEIDEYLSIDEYKDKAGSYAIQGIASKFIRGIDGDFDNVVGLPVTRLLSVLRDEFFVEWKKR